MFDLEKVESIQKNTMLIFLIPTVLPAYRIAGKFLTPNELFETGDFFIHENTTGGGELLDLFVALGFSYLANA